MKRLSIKILLSVLTLLPFASLWSTHALATPKHGNRIELAQAGTIGKSEAAEAAKATYGGKVLKIEEVKKGDKTLYRVKLLLKDGRVKIVTIDGSSGKAA